MGSMVARDFSSAHWGTEAPALGMGQLEVSSTHGHSCVGFSLISKIQRFPKPSLITLRNGVLLLPTL